LSACFAATWSLAAEALLGKDLDASQKPSARSPVIAISELFDLRAGQPQDEFTFLRDRVITEFISRYACFVPHRSAPFGMIEEDGLGSVLPSGRIHPADYLLVGRYSNIDSPDKKAVIHYGWFDLHAETYREKNGAHVKSGGTADLPAALADEIAKAVNLRPRASSTAESPRLAGARLSILPLVYLQVLDDNIDAGRKTLLDKQEPLMKSLKNALLSDLGVRECHTPYGVDLAETPPSCDYIVTTTLRKLKDKRWLMDMRLVDVSSLLVVSAASGAFASLQPAEVDWRGILAALDERILPVPSKPDGAALRIRREADLYLHHFNSFENVSSYDMKTGLPNYQRASVRFAAVRDCERAYHLVPQEPAMTYQAVWTLATVGNLNGREELSFPGAQAFEFASVMALSGMIRANTSDWAALSAHDFGDYRFAPDEVIPHLLQAQAMEVLGKYDEAEQFASLHEKSAPYTARDRLLAVRCRTALVRGDLDAAKKVLQIMKEQHPRSRWTVETELVVAEKTQDSEERFRILQHKVKVDRALTKEEDWFFYLEALPEYDGPELAIQELGAWLEKHRMSASFPNNAQHMVRWRQAECLMMLDRKEDAYRRAKDILATARFIDSPGGRRSKAGAESLVRSLADELGDVDELWKTPAALELDVARFKLYIAPIGSAIPEHFMETIAKRLSDFYGIQCRVLPAPRFDEETLETKQSFMKGILEGYTVPADALMVAFVSQYYPGNILPGNRGNPFILGCDHNLQTEGFPAEFYRQGIVGGIARTFHYSYSSRVTDPGKFPWGIERCKNDPCYFSAAASSYEEQFLRTSLCTDCQEEFAKLDFDAVQAELMVFLRNNKVIIGE
jgi:hypothetical protein